MSEPAVLSDVEGAIGVITINRPDKLNALDLATIEAMQAALSAMEANPAVRVIIFTGAGKAFIAGGDIADLNSRRGLAHYNEFAGPIHGLFRNIEICDKPTIGAVNGWALGGGCELMLALDIRIVSEKARIGVPEITLGLFPGAGGTQRLIRQIPLCRAKELMFAGDHISAEEAVALGLANRAVAPDELMPACKALAEKIAVKSPLALRLLKRTMANGADMALPSALAHEQAMISLALDSEDAHEGCSAFLEKRDANFTGS
ncbi:MAG TPA: enoyl-CoA hydratase/isomerase family protein [Alphaproteobacteria bacterium]|nr:enoyl-CoA hydratase/isomerase family protein [Alphaproteobacteria bacterium]HJN59460.1 enoyl-CoA hydratase/isomerase family protein [Alphaproteobacteria bacterium]